MAKKAKPDEKNLATNRAASHEFHLLQRMEAGIVLTGTEVKSARAGKVNLKDAFARIDKAGEIFLHNAHFSPYSHGNRQNHEPVRPRKLLLHAREIRKLVKQVEAGGRTLVPLRLYLKKGRVKVELALAQGKKLHDKREASRKREMEKEMEQARGARY